jgi:hypothetical protein
MVMRTYQTVKIRATERERHLPTHAFAAEASLAPLSPSSGGLAGQSDWERGGRAPCIASSVGFFLVVGLGAVSLGGLPPPIASLGGGRPISSSEEVWEWCPWPICRFFKLRPPPNKLLVRLLPDIGLEDPAVSSSSPPSIQVGSSASSPAGRGSEGMGSTLVPASSSEVYAGGAEGVSSPRCVTSSARGLVLSAHLGRAGRASPAMACVLLLAGWFLPRACLLRLPPPARGWC